VKTRIGVSAYRRVGARGAVGLRSRATGVARLETSLCYYAAQFYPRSPLFTFYGSATPDGRERVPAPA